MRYGYIQISSDKQTVENQRFEIENFAKANKFIIDGWKKQVVIFYAYGFSLLKIG